MGLTLIVTERLDPHADLVEGELERRGHPYIRFHLEDFPQPTAATYNVADSGAETLEIRGHRIAIDDVRAVWYRRTGPFDLPASCMSDRRVARVECGAFVLGLWHRLSHVRWVSSPAAIRAASNRFEQLIRAKQCGFSIAATCFSNNPDDVRGFVETHGSVIYKPNTPIIVPRDDGSVHVVHTTLLNDEALARLDEIRSAPGIFQRLIPKAYELRITVFGDRVFACRILSRARSETRVDWRTHDWDDPDSVPPHEATTIPDHVAECCRVLVRDYGLAYGAIDLVVTPEGEHVFLELNPNGQWAWIEQRTGLPLGNALIGLLQAS